MSFFSNIKHESRFEKSGFRVLYVISKGDVVVDRYVVILKEKPYDRETPHP